MLIKTAAVLYYSTDFRQLSEELEYFWSFENEKDLKDKFHKELANIHKAAIPASSLSS